MNFGVLLRAAIYSLCKKMCSSSLVLQSVTVPLQGFLNAIVYGWTRGDFLFIMAATSSHSYQKEAEVTSSLEPETGQPCRKYTPDLLSESYYSSLSDTDI